MAKSNTEAIGFEKHIWDAACMLRNVPGASMYQGVLFQQVAPECILGRFGTECREESH